MYNKFIGSSDSEGPVDREPADIADGDELHGPDGQLVEVLPDETYYIISYHAILYYVIV